LLGQAAGLAAHAFDEVWLKSEALHSLDQDLGTTPAKSEPLYSKYILSVSWSMRVRVKSCGAFSRPAWQAEPV